jgi:hypothetical protein
MSENAGLRKCGLAGRDSEFAKNLDAVGERERVGPFITASGMSRRSPLGKIAESVSATAPMTTSENGPSPAF